MKHNTTPQRPSSLPPETRPRCRALSSIPVVRGIIAAIGWRHCLFDFQFSNHFKRFLRILNLSNGHPAALHHPSAPIDCYRKNRLCDVQFVSKTATDRSTKEGGRRPVLQSFGESYTLDARQENADECTIMQFLSCAVLLAETLVTHSNERMHQSP